MLSAVAVALTLAAAPAPADTIPAWFREHLAWITRDGGRWVADNAAYRSGGEPWVAYGLTWTLGASGRMAQGQLFGIAEDGRERVFWDFVTYWDAINDRAVVVQVNLGGGYGVGELRGDGTAWELEQTFWGSDGITRQLHRERREGDTQDSRSFTWRDGAWHPDRHYVWRLERRP